MKAKEASGIPVKVYNMPGGNMEEDLVDPDWLFRQLRSLDGPNKLLILDCRAHSDFSEAHIRGSVPLAIPSSDASHCVRSSRVICRSVIPEINAQARVSNRTHDCDNRTLLYK